MDLFGDMASFSSVVSNSYYGMLRGANTVTMSDEEQLL